MRVFSRTVIMMQFRKRTDIANRLLLALPPRTLNRIRGVLEPVSLARGQVIAHTDEPLKHVYFINKGMASVVKTKKDGRSVEIGTIGIEGMTSAITLIGFERIVLESLVQIPGSAFRMSRDAAMQAMQQDKAFRQIVHDHARFLLGQKANRIKVVKGPAESGKNLFDGSREK